jgi:hypothetical protein
VLGGEDVNANMQTEKTETPASEGLAHLLARAEKGDTAVLPQLRRIVRRNRSHLTNTHRDSLT